MELHPLTPNDKATFDQYARKQPHALSSYAFANIFIWRPLFDISWALINKKFCLFFENKIGMFMPLPPLGGFDQGTLETVFEIMQEANNNKDVSRIENVETGDFGFFQAPRFRTFEKSKEYIVRQDDIANYRGQKFKHQRASYNFFKKNNAGQLRDYTCDDQEAVRTLYSRWMKVRMSKNSDSVYQAMLEDSFKAFKELLLYWEDLEVKAQVVVCDGEISAFTSGVSLPNRSFCINFEIANLSYKGLAAYIFSEFAKTLESSPEINIMDDSGIENIRRTKMMFKPARQISSHTALLV